MKKEELIKFLNWFNEIEDLGYTDKGIKFYVEMYLEPKTK